MPQVSFSLINNAKQFDFLCFRQIIGNITIFTAHSEFVWARDYYKFREDAQYLGRNTVTHNQIEENQEYFFPEEMWVVSGRLRDDVFLVLETEVPANLVTPFFQGWCFNSNVLHIPDVCWVAYRRDALVQSPVITFEQIKEWPNGILFHYSGVTAMTVKVAN